MKKIRFLPAVEVDETEDKPGNKSSFGVAFLFLEDFPHDEERIADFCGKNPPEEGIGVFPFDGDVDDGD